MKSDVSRGSSKKSIFAAAQRLSDSKQRQAYLEEACGEDLDLRVEVERLLAALDQTTSSPLDKAVEKLGPAQTGFPDRALEESIDVSSHPIIGPYKLLERLGEGGMGTVYMAQQKQPVKRKVALKLIKAGMDSKEVIARFEAERQALAMMEHSNIARIFDGGLTEQGRPYFVMELVRGFAIDQYCDQATLSLGDRLKLFIDVCRAVQHAHQKGIIHRDLKPSNILVTLHDGVPVVKVIDFGIAKALDYELTQRTLFTRFAELVGSPAYMSPEQAEISGLDVDTRSDVYSLGVLLYKLLVGVTPFDESTLKIAGFDEMRRIIREDEPFRPSHKVSTLNNELVSTISGRRGTDPRELSLSMQRELDWIVMKALEKDRTRRYESASHLAQDVQRYLDDEPVQACPPSVAYRLRKYARRHKSLLTTTALLVVVMIGGTVASLWYATKASKAATQAKVAQTDAERQTEVANDLAIRAELAAKETQRANVREAAQRKRAEKALYLSDARLAASQVDSGTHSEAFDTLLRQFPKDSARDLRSWEWYYLLDQSNQSLLSWQAHEANITSIDWSPDGKRIATASFDTAAAVWDAETGEELQRFTDEDLFKYGVDWHPESNQLAWGSSADEGVVRIWDEESDTVEILDANTHSIWSVSWNHDGSRLVVGAIPGLDMKPNQDARNLVIWKRVDGQWRIQARTAIPRNINSTAWNFDDSLVAVAYDGGYVGIYNSETLELVHQTFRFDPCDAAWHPSRNLLAFGTWSGRCFIFDAEDFTEQTRFEAHMGELCQLQWSQNGEYLASCGADGFVKIWNTTDWSLSNTFSGHSGKVNQVSWHTDSERIASAGSDGIVNIWSVSSRKPNLELDSAGDGSGDRFAWTTDQLIRTISHPSSVIDREPRTAKIKRTISLPSVNTSWRLRGRNLALREFTEGVPPKLDFVTIGVHNSVSEVSGGISAERGHIPICSHDDLKTIAFNSGDYGRTALFDLSARQERKLGAEQFVVVKQMAWSEDGNAIAIVGGGLDSHDGNIKYAAWLYLVDPATGADIARTRVGRHRALGMAVAWSPDSQRIAAASRDGTCEIFDSQLQRRLISRKIHRASVAALSWHPGGSRIASGGDDQTVNIWDSATGETILKLPVKSVVSHIEWSPDGKLLAAQEKTGTIRIWDASAGFSFAESSDFQRRITRRIRNDFQAARDAEEFLLAKQHGMTLLDREGDWNCQLYYSLGLLCAAAEDNIGYVDVCQRMMEKFSDAEQSIAAHFTTWTCALAPDAIEGYGLAIKLARHAVEKKPDNRQYLNGLGAILMRSGRYEEAKIVLERALEAADSNNTSPSYIHYFLAFTEHHLGHEQAAAQQLQIANATAAEELAGSPAWNRKLTLELLRDQADGLLGAPEASQNAAANSPDDHPPVIE